MTPGWRGLIRAAYWVVVAAVFAASVAPISEGAGGINDKVEHFAAFYLLELGAAVLFPRRPLWFAATLLVGYGGLIEIVQGLDFVGRDRDLLDWVTDVAAIVCAALPLAFSRLRARLGGDKPGD